MGMGTLSTDVHERFTFIKSVYKMDTDLLRSIRMDDLNGFTKDGLSWISPPSFW